jgi:hypothetical protein
VPRLIIAPALLVLALAFGGDAPAVAAPLVQQGSKLTDAEVGEAGQFGRSVALSGDGDTALIGAPRDRGTGAAWIFSRTANVWSTSGQALTPGEASAESFFGRSVALSADGNTALVGATQDEGGRGAAWVFVRSGANWIQQGPKLTEPEIFKGHFGSAVALSADGDTALIGGAREGKAGRGATAWVFTRSGSTWTQQGEPLTVGGEGAVGHIGARVALAANGETALLGAPNDEDRRGSAWLFALSQGTWVAQAGPLVGAEASINAHLGSSVALSSDGATALVSGARDEGLQGAAWVFTGSGATWAQQGPALTDGSPGDEGLFGYATALSGDGDIALIGAPRYDGEEALPAAWTFTRSGSSWSREAQGVNADEEIRHDRFGDSVALSGDGATALIGGPRDGLGSGAAWLFAGAASTPVPPEPAVGASAAAASGSGTSGGVANAVALSGVLSSQTSGLPLPRLGQTANLRLLSGTVLVKLPGSTRFVPLTAALQVPFGTIIDATHGRVALTTARLHGGTGTMTFFDGQFEIAQRRDGLVISTLNGGNFSECPTASERGHRAITSSSHASRKHVVRKLWAEGHGSYSTKGNYASGAVLGTRWLTEDRCDGTLIHVATDSVRVTNLRTHHHLKVTAGHSYLAKAP